MKSRWHLVLPAALVSFIYLQTLDFAFINYDDDAYVTANPRVVDGLSVQSVQWAFTSLERFYWHPLTWLSHLTDVSLFGVEPGPMHAVNMLLHLLSSCLLLIVVTRLTGTVRPSLAVALLFAVHPLKVESVAWIAERKDVLSGFLIVATLGAYERYVRQPSSGRYAATYALFLLALAAKPAAVIVPLLLMILDFWPLQRFAFREKIPFFAVSAIVAGLTVTGAERMGALDMLGPVPVTTRVANAFWSLGIYLYKTLVPLNLAALYPYRQDLPFAPLMAAGLSGVTVFAVLQRKRRPWILASWLWFVIALVPTLGFIQAGVQARADRFTYVAHIGLLIVFIWTAYEFLPTRAHTGVLAAVVLVFTYLSYVQTSTWKNSETVFAHAVAHTSTNWLAEYKYGLALSERGANVDAVVHLRRAVDANASDPYSRLQLGRVAAAEGRFAEAADWFAQTVRVKPDYGDAHYSLGTMFVALGREGEALAAFERSIQSGLAPEWKAKAHLSAGIALARSGKIVDAQEHFRAALSIQPNFPEAKHALLLTEQDLRRTMGEKFGTNRSH
jgi:Tfp pilus assembly protein PilF